VGDVVFVAEFHDLRLDLQLRPGESMGSQVSLKHPLAIRSIRGLLGLLDKLSHRALQSWGVPVGAPPRRVHQNGTPVAVDGRGGVRRWLEYKDRSHRSKITKSCVEGVPQARRDNRRRSNRSYVGEKVVGSQQDVDQQASLVWVHPITVSVAGTFGADECQRNRDPSERRSRVRRSAKASTVSIPLRTDLGERIHGEPNVGSRDLEPRRTVPVHAGPYAAYRGSRRAEAIGLVP
jgi:hypothetical protein